MTLTEMTRLMNEHHENFGSDYAGFYDISETEARRIAARSEDVEDFENVWSGQVFWLDINN